MKYFLFPTVHDFFALRESFRQQLMSMHKKRFTYEISQVQYGVVNK